MIKFFRRNSMEIKCDGNDFTVYSFECKQCPLHGDCLKEEIANSHCNKCNINPEKCKR